jgi:diguanylate cyclase (GGDEF)-like protein
VPAEQAAPNAPQVTRTSRAYDATVFAAGTLVAAFAAVLALTAPDRHAVGVGIGIGVALIVALGYFEVRLTSSTEHTVDPWVSLESAGLIFLAYHNGVAVALASWAFGHLVLVVIMKVSTIAIRRFNFGLFLTSGAVALGIIRAFGGVPEDASVVSARTVLTLSLSSFCYVAVMFATLTVSIALEERVPLRSTISGRNTVIAACSIASINSLAFLAILLAHAYPLWLMTILVVPVGAVLTASRLLFVSHEQAQTNRALAEQMEHMAHHDALTGLPNRKMFLDRADLAVSAAQGSDVAILFIDLDGFKAVNDEAGHGAGDALLVEVANRLRQCVRQVDLVGRIGGDEFVILVEPVESVEGLVTLAERLIEAMSAPVSLRGRPSTVGSSIGIAMAMPGEDANAVLAHADAAMYVSKNNGKNRATMYEPPQVPARLRS